MTRELIILRILSSLYRTSRTNPLVVSSQLGPFYTKSIILPGSKCPHPFSQWDCIIINMYMTIPLLSPNSCSAHDGKGTGRIIIGEFLFEDIITASCYHAATKETGQSTLLLGLITSQQTTPLRQRNTVD